MQQREVISLLRFRELSKRGEHPIQLRQRVRRVRERLLLLLRILKVPFHAHGAEEKPADVDARLACDERMLHRARAPALRDERTVATPLEVGGFAIRTSRREAQAL